jgi:hypothetical protein
MTGKCERGKIKVVKGNMMEVVTITSDGNETVDRFKFWEIEEFIRNRFWDRVGRSELRASRKV